MTALINLNNLPAPNVVELIDFESIFNERKARLIELYPEDQRVEVEKTLSFESEPLVKLLQENAYRELLLRQRINNAAKSVMLAYAAGSDLDMLAANYNVTRLIITQEDTTVIPNIPAVMESDNDLRLRAQQAYEGLTTAGSTASYEYHALSADGRIADVSAYSPSPSVVVVSILSRDGDGSADVELIGIVDRALNSENVRPVADRTIVQTAQIIHYEINADLFMYPSPESELVMLAAKDRLETYINMQRRLGRDIRRSAIYAALTVEGVQNVELKSPAQDIKLDKTQAAYCDKYQIDFGGFDE